MPTAPPNPAAFGHIASLLRIKMAEHNLKSQELSKKLNCSPSAVYFWLRANNSPGPEMRSKLSKMFNISETDLLPKRSVVLSESKALIVTAKKPSAVYRPTNTHNPLVFTITSEGMANIKMDVTMPLEVAQPLLRMLLDAGIVFSKPQGDSFGKTNSNETNDC